MFVWRNGRVVVEREEGVRPLVSLPTHSFEKMLPSKKQNNQIKVENFFAKKFIGISFVFFDSCDIL